MATLVQADVTQEEPDDGGGQRGRPRDAASSAATLVSRRVRPHLVNIWVNIKAIAIPRAARQALA